MLEWKSNLLNKIQSCLDDQVLTARKAALQAHAAATNTESIAENKYDTFGLEASYLAHGQSARVQQAELDSQEFRGWQVGDLSQNQHITSGALVAIEPNQLPEQSRYLFICPWAGGLRIELDQITVLLISPESPVAKKLIGRERGDECAMTFAGKEGDYYIEDFC
ncbi:hypothetical protein [Marinomonas epiphytica]